MNSNRGPYSNIFFFHLRNLVGGQRLELGTETLALISSKNQTNYAHCNTETIKQLLDGLCTKALKML